MKPLYTFDKAQWCFNICEYKPLDSFNEPGEKAVKPETTVGGGELCETTWYL